MNCIVIVHCVSSHYYKIHSQNELRYHSFFLQPENVMLRDRTSDDLKLIDFGLSREIDPDEPIRVMFGTPEYVAPEVVNYEPVGLPTDIWSLGVLAYIM